jgi:hypothetical protein
MVYGTYRAFYATSKDRLFAICGNSLFEIFTDASSVQRGVLSSVSGKCTITENETQLLILDGLDGYIYILRDNTLTKLTNLNDVVDSVILISGGTGYTIGDTLTLAEPSGGVSATVLIDTVDVLGAVTGITLGTRGRGYTEGDKTTTGGTGTGAVINVESLASGGFNSGVHCVNLDGYFIKNKNNTGEFYYSYLRDGLTWDILDYFTAEGTPDNIVTLGKINNELWVFGSKTIEVWYDTGNTDALFQRISQGFIDIGCAAEWSVATMGNTIFWLGSSSQGHGIVWMASNYIPQRISTHAIEYIIGQINKESTIADAEAYCYQEEGHFYYVLTFPSGNRTLVYDLKTSLWHERGEWDSLDGRMNRHRGSLFSFWNGKNYLCDYQNTNIYNLDLDTFTDNGKMIRRVRTGPHIRNDRKRLFHREFEIDIERGVGLTSGQGSNPLIVLYFSDDGGKTWSNGIPLNMGKIGEYLVRAHTHRLGMSRDRVYRLVITDPVKCVLVSARADIEVERGN